MKNPRIIQSNISAVFGPLLASPGGEISLPDCYVPVAQINEADVVAHYFEAELYCGAKKEVRTPAGNIDLLTDHFLYEMKQVEKWKEAIGQLVAYGTYYPNHKKVLVVFGTFDEWENREEVICEVAASAGISRVSFSLDPYRELLSRTKKSSAAAVTASDSDPEDSPF